MSYEDNFLFQWYPTCHIFTMGSFEKRGAERGALTKLWMALKHKKLMKKHTVTTCLSWEQISAPLSAPFPETYPIWKDTSIEFLWHEAHILWKLTSLWPSKWSCAAHWKKMKKWKLKKWKLQKIAMCFSFQTRCCKIRTRWATRIIF